MQRREESIMVVQTVLFLHVLSLQREMFLLQLIPDKPCLHLTVAKHDLVAMNVTNTNETLFMVILISQNDITRCRHQVYHNRACDNILRCLSWCIIIFQTPISLRNKVCFVYCFLTSQMTFHILIIELVSINTSISNMLLNVV